MTIALVDFDSTAAVANQNEVDDDQYIEWNAWYNNQRWQKVQEFIDAARDARTCAHEIFCITFVCITLVAGIIILLRYASERC